MGAGRNPGAYIGADARQSGIFQGEEIAVTENQGDINGDGEVSYIMIQGEPENIDTQYRTAYSVKALEEAGVETRELLAQTGDWSQSQGQKIMEEALDEFGNDIEVVFCNNDAMALGALEAIREADRTVGEDIYLTGWMPWKKQFRALLTENLQARFLMTISASPTGRQSLLLSF